jgi:hypothetical protein
MGDAVVLYLQAVAEDGDWLNDWLTHMPTWLARIMEVIGRWLAKALEHGIDIPEHVRHAHEATPLEVVAMIALVLIAGALFALILSLIID